MSDSEVVVERRGSVCHIAINRPERRNALNSNIISRLSQAISAANGDDEIRAIVLTGTGDKAFCAGADLSGGTGTFLHDYASPTMPLADLMRAAKAVSIPIIARVNGACVAGGMGLLAMCDLAVAANHAVFGLPEVKIGMFPYQVLAALGDVLLPRHLNELCMTGEMIDAQHAVSIGLVNHIVPADALDEKLEWLLSRLVERSPTALRRGKYSLRAIDGMTFDQRLSFLESQVPLGAVTEDAREGVASFNEKRRPHWTNK